MYSSQEWFSNTEAGGGGDAGDPIGYSLRFRTSQYLTRTAVTPTDATKFTLSCWVKRSDLQGTNRYIMTAGVDKDNKNDNLVFNGDHTLEAGQRRGGGEYRCTTNAIYRDPAAWMHIVYTWENGNKNLYVNGEEPSTSRNVPATDPHYWQNAGQEQTIGRDPNWGGSPTAQFSGFMAEYHFIDGQILEPTEFGRFNDNGIWVPVEAEGLTYGANGFYLDFADANDMGKDVSGNDNDFTTHGFDFDPATTGFDQMVDSPTQNYATLNYINRDDQPSAQYSDANMRVTHNTSSSSTSGYPTIQVSLNDDNKYYIESFMESVDATTYPALYFNRNSRTGANVSSNLYFYQEDSGNIVFGDGRANDSGTSWTTGDTVGITIDPANDSVTIQVNGGASNTVDLQSLNTDVFLVASLNTSSSYAAWWNGGQQPFKYQPEGTVPYSTLSMPEPTIKDGKDHFQAITAGPNRGATAGQRGGNWSAFLTSQTGVWWDPNTANNTHAFDGLNNTNAQAFNANDGMVWEGFDPISVTSSVEIGINAGYDTAPVILTIDGVEHQTTLAKQNPLQTAFSGSGTLTKIEFPPGNGNYGGSPWGFAVDGELLVDSGPLAAAQKAFPYGLWWIKARPSDSVYNNHQLVDSVRGKSGGNDYQALGSNITDNQSDYRVLGNEAVAWCWKAGSSGVTDNTGSLQSTVYVNDEAGFSIVRWTGNGGFESVGHGLGYRPSLIITKAIDTNSNWCVGLDGVTTLTGGGAADQWITPQSFVTTNWGTAFTLNDGAAGQGLQASEGINVSGAEMIAYCWRAVEGYSSFGTYIGHGNSDTATEGAFVYCGFKPAFVLTKCVTAGSDFIIFDNSRDLHNSTKKILYVNQDLPEAITTGQGIDILANGFKIRQGGSYIGDAGQTYMYWAFAENPIQSPTTVR